MGGRGVVLHAAAKRLLDTILILDRSLLVNILSYFHYCCIIDTKNNSSLLNVTKVQNLRS